MKFWLDEIVLILIHICYFSTQVEFVLLQIFSNRTGNDSKLYILEKKFRLKTDGVWHNTEVWKFSRLKSKNKMMSCLLNFYVTTHISHFNGFSRFSPVIYDPFLGFSFWHVWHHTIISCPVGEYLKQDKLNLGWKIANMYQNKYSFIQSKIHCI